MYAANGAELIGFICPTVIDSSPSGDELLRSERWRGVCGPRRRSFGCVVGGNQAYMDGGGVYCAAGGKLHGCTNIENAAGDSRRGILLREGGVVSNCVVSDN